MKILFIAVAIAAFNLSYGQQKITFGYDTAGNQINRVLCLSGCAAKQSKDIKEIEAITDQDMLKFSAEDEISYYPNPVKEELYLKWQVVEGNQLLFITVYGLNGQLLKSYVNTPGTNTQNIPFSDYAEGIYMVVLNYKNSDPKTIKIIKQ
jgi:hypothetical protein